ncbi:hypothetical protein Tco_0086208 [Tanacetum coccineum]
MFYQPPVFEDPDFPDRVYKVEKALYGLHQLLEIDDIIFRSTKNKLCTEFEKMMHKKFQMSSMGQTKLGLWYPKDSPFNLVAYTDSDYAGASLDRKSTTGEAEYVAASSCYGQYWNDKSLKAYKENGEATAKVKTINREVQLQALVDGKKVIITETSVRRDLQLEDAEGIKCLPNADIFKQLALMGYEKPSQKLTFYKAFFSPQWKFLIHTILQCLTQEEMGKGSAMPTEIHHIPIIQPSTSQPQKKQSRRKQRKGTKIPQSSVPTEPVADEAVHEEKGDSVERVATTDSSLEVEQDSGNIIRTQSTAISNVPLPQGISSGGRPKRQETMGDRPAQTRFESLSKQSNDLPLSRVNTLGSGDDRLKLKELMDLYTKLSDRVLDLVTTKTTQAKEIVSLKKRVKKLERKRKLKTPGMKTLFKIGRSARVISSDEDSLGDQEDASKQGRKITDIDQDAKVTLVDETQGRYDDAQMFDTDVFNGEEVFVAEKSEKVVKEVVSTAKVSAAATITTEEITLAQALAELRSKNPEVVDKSKAKMIEPEKPLKKKEQIRLDEELAFKLQAEEEEQARLTREKAEKVEEANISWDNVQAMIEANRLLAERLQAREQKELTDEEKAILFVQLLEKRKKHFAALKAHEKRNKPPTKAQKKSIMSTYLKHMAGYKQSQLKNKSFAEIQKLFDKAMTRSSSKRAGEELEQEVAKKHKMEDDKEKEDLKQCFEIKLVKAKHGNTRREEGYERVLWGDLKTMFEHHVEDLIWRNLQGKKVLLWRLYDSCGIHFVRFEDMHVYMLVEKRYSLTPETITDMLNKKLKSDYWNEMCYQLLKLMTKQLKKQ